MSNKEILKKAIKKASNNEFYVPFSLREVFDKRWDKNKFFHYYYHFIFDHEFAKTFWGKMDLFPMVLENNRKVMAVDVSQIPKDIGLKEFMEVNFPNEVFPHKSMKLWQWHLQQMVLEENPIKYLEKFLDE